MEIDSRRSENAGAKEPVKTNSYKYSDGSGSEDDGTTQNTNSKTVYYNDLEELD